MTNELDRRTVLKGIAVGATTLTFAGAVTANGHTRYLVETDGPGTRKRVEKTDFTVQHSLAAGGVLLVTGPSKKRRKLENVDGVVEVAEDVAFELEGPELQENRPNENGRGGHGGPGPAGASQSTNEEFFGLQWDKQDLTTDAAIAHERATGVGTRLAIIDTGIDHDHPDLEANVLPDEGRLFRYGSVTHDTQDVYGHGTHVAGIAAASDAGTQGVVGTAPDADLVSLRVFFFDDVDGDGQVELVATFGDIMLAIDHAARIGADAMNMSIGTPPLPPQVNAGGIRGALERVIQSAVARGSVVVASAGNSSANLQQGGYFTLPNSISGAMSISATGPNDKLVFYSNFGTNEIDVGAPGGGYETLEKTLEDDTDWPFPTNLVLNAMDPDSVIGQALGGVEYAYLAGTSMAAPQVTGTAGLLREVAPDSTAKQVEKAIEQGAEHVPGESDAELGAGRLNCDRALDADAID